MKNSLVKILSILFSMGLVLSACGTRDYSDAETEKKKAELKKQEEQKKSTDQQTTAKANVTWGGNIKLLYERYPTTAKILEKAAKFSVYGGAFAGLGYGAYRYIQFWRGKKAIKKSAKDDGDSDHPTPGGGDDHGPDSGPTPNAGGGGVGGAVNPVSGRTETHIHNHIHVGSHADGHKTNWQKVAMVTGGLAVGVCAFALADFFIDAVDTSVKGAVNEFLTRPPAITAPAVPGQQ